MKKIRMLAIGLLSFFSTSLFAAEAGRVQVASDDAVAIDNQGIVRKIQKGDLVSSGDRIESHSGHVQIEFTDGTVVALQPKGQFVVQRYRYEKDKPKETSFLLGLLKGGLRTVTGTIAKINNQNYKVRTPVATIGVRGTDYIVAVEDKRSLLTVVSGLVDVSNEYGSVVVSVGQSAEVKPNMAPSYSKEQLPIVNFPAPVKKLTSNPAPPININKSIKQAMMAALVSSASPEAALKKVVLASPDQAYIAVAAALQINPDQVNALMAFAIKQLNLDPAQLVASALQVVPNKSAIIVTTALVKAPSSLQSIMQAALSGQVDAATFMAQALRVAPQQTNAIVSIAAQIVPNQMSSIMKAIIKDQPDKSVVFMRAAISAGIPAVDVVTAALSVSPKQASYMATAVGVSQKELTSAMAANAAQAEPQLRGSSVDASDVPVPIPPTASTVPLPPASPSWKPQCLLNRASCS